MPALYKVLGQALPRPNTFTDLYICPAGANAIISTINICNITGGGSIDAPFSANTSFRLMVRVNGNTSANSQYLAFNVPVTSADSVSLSIGVSLGANDAITGLSVEGNAAMTVFGTELRP